MRPRAMRPWSHEHEAPERYFVAGLLGSDRPRWRAAALTSRLAPFTSPSFNRRLAIDTQAVAWASWTMTRTRAS